MLFTTSACTLPLLIMYENRIKGLKANSISERGRAREMERKVLFQPPLPLAIAP